MEVYPAESSFQDPTAFLEQVAYQTKAAFQMLAASPSKEASPVRVGCLALAAYLVRAEHLEWRKYY